MATTESATYRATQNKRVDSSSDEEGQISDDSSDECSNKRMKTSENRFTTTHIQPTVFKPATSSQLGQHKKRKVKNIWGSVIADQSSNDISNTLGTVGMKNFMSRGPESFSLELAFKDRKEMNQSWSSSSDDENGVQEESEPTIEQEMEDYLIKRQHLNNHENNASKVQGKKQNLKRKRPKKRKPGQVPNYQPGQKVTLNKKYELSVDDSEDKVAEELAFRLWEKKKDLVRALVSAMGIEKALFLYEKTAALELNGGLMTLQGNRRRTPGGTFIYLVRNDEDLDQSTINKVFEVESLRQKEQWLASKQAKKQQQPDVGETPHNSPSINTYHLGAPTANDVMEDDATTSHDVMDEASTHSRDVIDEDAPGDEMAGTFG